MPRIQPVLVLLATIPALGAAGVASAGPTIATIAKPVALALPGGEAGIGFDDLGWAGTLHRVLAPGGRTGKLALIDPASQKLVTVGGFSQDTDAFAGGHGEGTTSADAGGGLLFASDWSRTEVVIIDPASLKVIGHQRLAGGPDYVRWVAPLGELWVTEPGKKQIETFTLVSGVSGVSGAKGSKDTLAKRGAIAISGGPESLVIDATRKRAYTHTWQDETVAIDLDKHAEVARWNNGCKGSRGIALDEPRGLVFVGCEEGRATVLDVAHGGKRVASVATGKGVDIIAYAPALAHLYVPGGDSATLTIVGVGKTGALTTLGSVAVAADSHCVAADDRGHAYVCDPKHGALLVVTDPFPATR